MSDLIERLRGEHWASLLCGEAANKIEAQQAEIARLREAVAEAEKVFRWYGDLHAAKPDPEKAARNYEMADEMAAALEQKP